MSRSAGRIGAGIFNAASAPLRMQMLSLLSTKGALAYTEIMSSIKLDAVRDAGKFVYHLRSLADGGLISLDKQAKKYEITELGEMMVQFARDVEEYVNVKRGKLFVRTSRVAIEDFHRSKIAKSLVVEAGIPQELADEIAAEAEDRLNKLRSSYLTSALIREFVNSILIEKKLVEYRHKLTRLGMPVYDVTQLLSRTGELGLRADYVQREAAASVLEEYVLIECLPREIADAHISGRIHICDLDAWPLKPSEVQHDLRYFLMNGLVGSGHPSSFDAALAMTRSVYRHGIAEVSGEQGFDFFNIFLAPYVKSMSDDALRESLRLFLSSLAQDSAMAPGISLSFEYTVPDFLESVEAVGAGGRSVGVYGDYSDEAKRILDAILETMSQVAQLNPLTNPRLIVKMRDSVRTSEELRPYVLKTFDLAASRTLPHIALLRDGSRECYTATGFRLTDDWSKQWESDCYRTGCMATVFLNLPRLVYEARKDYNRLFNLMSEVFDLAVEAFKIKKTFMIDRLKQPIQPLLFGSKPGVPYFREKMATYAIALLGLKEASLAHTGSNLKKDLLTFVDKVLRELNKKCEAASNDFGMRLVVSERPGDDVISRLAELDIEEYGKSSVSVQGARGHPFYNDLTTLPLSPTVALNEGLAVEGLIQTLTPGGHLTAISVNSNVTPDDLLSLTNEAAQNRLGFIAFSRFYTFCKNCNLVVKELISSCSTCASDNVAHYGRSAATYVPLSLWPQAKKWVIEKRAVYS